MTPSVRSIDRQTLATLATAAVVAAIVGFVILWPLAQVPQGGLAIGAIGLVLVTAFTAYDFGKREGRFQGEHAAGLSVHAIWDAWERAHPEDFPSDEDGVPYAPSLPWPISGTPPTD